MKQASIRKTIVIFLAAVLFLSVMGVSFASGDYYNESKEGNETLTEKTDKEIKAADIQLNWVDAPLSIEETEDLHVDYEIENYGDQTGNESFVDLYINGTIVDAHEDIELAPGETHQGTLNYTDVDANYDVGDTISWSVELWDYGDSMSGQTDVGVPDFVINTVNAPDNIEETDNLTVGYEIENVGNGTGEESFVDLVIDGSFVDTHEDIELAPGETYQDTLVYSGVDGNYSNGDNISWAVQLWDFGDSMSGKTYVGIPDFVINWVDAPNNIKETDDLPVNYEIENVGNGTGKESFVDLVIDGSFVDTHQDIELAPGETYQDTLVYTDVDANYDNGDTISWTVELWDYSDSMSGETHVGVPEIIINSVSAPSEIPENENLTVDFEIENVGNGTGNESFVDLLIQNNIEVTEEPPALGPGETYQDTLVYTGVDSNYNDGDTISWSVELWDFTDTMSGQTDVVAPTIVDHVMIMPNTDQVITAGDTIDFDAEAYDPDNNLIDGEDMNFTWQNTDEMGMFNETTAGDYDVTATLDGVTSNITMVTVEPAAVDHVMMTPNTDQVITAGNTVQFSASAYDMYDNMITNDPTDFNWQNTDGSGLFDETSGGDYDVMSSYGSVSSNSVTVTVEPAGTDQVEIMPQQATIMEMGMQAYTSTSYDQYGNEIDDVTGMTNWSDDVTPSEASNWMGNEISVDVGGEWTITGEYDGFEDTATLTVVESYNLTVNIEGEGMIMVEVYENGAWQEIAGSPITDGWNDEPAPEGTEVRFTAQPAEGYGFVEWTQDVTSSDEVIEMTINEDIEMTANFEELETDIQVTNYDVDVDGLEVTVTADVENVGNSEGTIELMISGEEYGTLTLGPGESESINETYELEEEGDHTVELGDQSETVTVGDTDGGSDSNEIPGFTVVLLVSAVVIAVAIFYKRKS